MLRKSLTFKDIALKKGFRAYPSLEAVALEHCLQARFFGLHFFLVCRPTATPVNFCVQGSQRSEGAPTTLGQEGGNQFGTFKERTGCASYTLRK
jgi:hypothetical protein